MSDELSFETNPTAFVLAFEQTIAIVAKKYSARNNITPYSSEDIQQHIRLKLLEQLPSIAATFQGKASIKTYMTAVIRNMCLEFIRKNCPQEISCTPTEPAAFVNSEQSSYRSALSRIYITEEVFRLKHVFLIFDNVQSKVELALKTYFHHSISLANVERYILDQEGDLAKGKEFLLLVSNVQSNADSERFGHLNHLFNSIEQKSNSVEATRKWTLRKLDQVLERMNGDQNVRNHTKETLSILLDFHTVSLEPEGLFVLEQ